MVADGAIECINKFKRIGGIVTNNMEYALRFVRELKVGTVNINEVPGYRIGSSPFGGIKDSELGIKEGVIEAIKCFTFVKTFSLPWQGRCLGGAISIR
ncbi:aldehyde dehydrogenase family protein [Niabella hirudinis]|uniref:aldehyde dehydrogenase family protein n=1 Tax=Niabella hirudinis TaxID=1285929 RepID=UPI003EBA3ACA